MKESTRGLRGWQMLLTALIGGVLLPLFGMSVHASAAALPGAAQQTDSSDQVGGDGEGSKVYGLIEVMPEGALVGEWTIGGKQYTTVAQTQFNQSEGEFAVGVCVKVNLKPDQVTVRELDSEPARDCNSGGGNGGGDNGGDKEGREIKGLVEAMPTGSLIGQWTIAGGVYTVTEQTEIKQKYGPIEVGVCVQVKLTQDDSTVRELQSKREMNCKEDDDNDGEDQHEGKGELYARLVSFPPALIGEWVVGSLTFQADAATEFDQERGAFTVGEFVKVEFVIQQDGTFLAKEIRSVNTKHDDEDGEHGDRDMTHDGKAFGVIDSVADGGLGVWQIGGISYTVTATTELNAKNGALVAGQNVKVEYLVDAEGSRIAKEIKSMPPTAGDPQGLLKLVGFVDAMPSDGFSGEWSIGGVIFQADANSKFEEENGLLDVGVFVEVKYFMEGDTRRIVELETHVLPGGGDDDHIGKIERMDDSMAAAAAGVAAASWRIGSRDYTVSDATLVGANVTADSTVLVNSYTAADGAQVATRISSVTLTTTLFLPAALK